MGPPSPKWEREVSIEWAAQEEVAGFTFGLGESVCVLLGLGQRCSPGKIESAPAYPVRAER